MTKNPLLSIPDPILPDHLDACRDALDIKKKDVCTMIGKDPSFWSKFLSGERDMSLSDLNTILTHFYMRRQALDDAEAMAEGLKAYVKKQYHR